MDIKVYGTETSGHHLVISLMSDILLKAQIPFKITEVNDVTEFLAQGIESIPAIQLNDDQIFSLKTNGSFNDSLRFAVNQILATENYGDLPKFLIPIDFSEMSLKALSFGHRLATDLGAITQVVHIYRPKTQVDENAEIKIITSQTEAKEKLDHIVKMMDKDWGSDIFQSSLVTGYFDVGFPTEKILDNAEDNAVEFIILGSTGSDNIYRKWLGSVSTDIVAKANVPVLLIPEEAKYRGISSIMVGIDEQPLSNYICQLLSNLCSKFKSTIHLVHIGPMKDNALLDTSKDILSQYYDANYIKTEAIESDDVLNALNIYSSNNEIDIVAVVPKHKSIFNKIFEESITKRMTQKLEKPLLVLK